MARTVQVGTILIKNWPGMTQLLGIERPCSGEWSLLKILDGFTFDRKIRAAGWNFFFMAAEVKVMFFGSLGAVKIQNALKRILEKVKLKEFNGLEVTQIVARRFLGLALRNHFCTLAPHATELLSRQRRSTFQRNAE
ncbi:MAG: hypothetical protein WBV55_23190 [Candidatus Sulfotelmatobacter sp.]